MADYERIVLSVCRDLGIEVGRPGPSQMELRIPGPLRRLFYNRAIVRLTTMQEQKRADTDLEFLGPGCSVLDCLEAAARARGGTAFEAVAGPPSRVSAGEYLAAFDAKHLHVDGSNGAAGLLPRGLRTVGGELVATFESYLRAVIEMRVDGPRPLHEVFPVVVRIRDGAVVSARPLSDAPLYPLDELPGTDADRPERVPAEVVLRCTDAVYREARARATALAGVAAGAAAESVATALEEIEKYFSEQVSADPAHRADFVEAYERQCAAARARGEVSARLAAVTMGLVHEVHPKLRVSLQDRAARVHSLDVPCVRGRALIRDDVVTCGHFGRSLTYLPARGLVCTECAPECAMCGLGMTTPGCHTCVALRRKSCPLCVSDACDVCDDPLCSEHTQRSASGRSICSKCVVGCAQDGATVGTDEAWRCGCPAHAASGVFCASHLQSVACSHGRVCASHERTSSIGGLTFCEGCVRCCAVCQRTIGEPQTVNCYWKGCAARICHDDTAAARCAICEKPTCPSHAETCEITGSRCCASDVRTCSGCDRTTRMDEVQPCEVCRNSLCRNCRTASGTGGVLCTGCGAACAADGVTWPLTRLAACDGETSDRRYCGEHVRRVACCGQSLCAEHHVRVACEHERSCRPHAVATAPDEALHCVRCVVDCLPCARPVPRSRAQPCTRADCSSQICRPHAESAVCVVCKLSFCPRHLLRCSESADLACDAHAAPCATCSKIDLRDALKACGACGGEFCASCRLQTTTGAWACGACFGMCSVDGAVWFTRELLTCESDHAGSQLCEQHRTKVACCGAVLCSDHALNVACVHGLACKKHTVQTAHGGVPHCALCVGTCPDCTAPVPSTDLSGCVAPSCRVQLCGPHSSIATCVECAGVVCADHRVYCTGESALCCPSHVAACGLCAKTHPASRLRQCASCGRRACHACTEATAGGDVGCSECVEPCSAGGEIHLRRELVQCVDDASPHWLCDRHGIKPACCARLACSAHALECKATGVKLCERDAGHCLACQGPLAGGAGHACACGARYCGVCSDVPRCVTGREALCPVHVLSSAESGASTCAEHSVPCGVCGGRLCEGEGSTCQGGERICRADALACAHCATPICAKHGVQCTGETAICCPSHVVACELCAKTHPASRLTICGGCGRQACHACTVATAGGGLGCSECVEACSAGGEVHLRRDLVQCVDGATADWLCDVHGIRLACCSRLACPTHALECTATGVKLCARDAGHCLACRGPLASGAGHACACGARYCGVCTAVPRCVTGNEALCPDHLLRSTESGALTCTEHSAPCGICGGRLNDGEGSACRGGERLCRTDALACAHCATPICVKHTHTLAGGERRCARCVRRCCDCGPQSLTAVELSTACLACGKDVCQSHGTACRKHGQTLCRGCAHESPFHHGAYCQADLGTCRCCTVRTVVDPATGLCDLCALFVDPSPGTPDLPFSLDLVKRFVRERAGVRIGGGSPKWRIGEKAVLLWVRSPILRRDTCAFLDLSGKELGIGTPSPERARRE